MALFRDGISCVVLGTVVSQYVRMGSESHPKRPSIHPDTRIGHMHLRVSNIERSVAFYRDILGFHETTHYDDRSAFLAAGNYHHHIALNIWGSEGGTRPPKGHTGLYHVAILLPNREELARVVQCLRDAQYPLLGASDHGVSEAVYLEDPDGNGIELYWDRPPHEWPRDREGKLAMVSKPLDLSELVRADKSAR